MLRKLTFLTSCELKHQTLAFILQNALQSAFGCSAATHPHALLELGLNVCYWGWCGVGINRKLLSNLNDMRTRPHGVASSLWVTSSPLIVG